MGSNSSYRHSKFEFIINLESYDCRVFQHLTVFLVIYRTKSLHINTILESASHKVIKINATFSVHKLKS